MPHQNSRDCTFSASRSLQPQQEAEKTLCKSAIARSKVNRAMLDQWPMRNTPGRCVPTRPELHHPEAKRQMRKDAARCVPTPQRAASQRDPSFTTQKRRGTYVRTQRAASQRPSALRPNAPARCVPTRPGSTRASRANVHHQKLMYLRRRGVDWRVASWRSSARSRS
jgi:hypothetical protein